MSTKPTLLAFHGSGSNATIHSVQLARLMRHLKQSFNIENLEGPFPSAAGPGVLPFFEGCGPYKRWLPASNFVDVASIKSTGISTASSVLPQEVETLVRDAVATAKASGSKVVGLIGFSQGTRVVAGLLKGTEIRRAIGAKDGDGLEWLDFSFALSICGSYPPPLIPPSATSALEASSLSPEEQKAVVESKIQIPTLHDQGTRDEWKWSGELIIKTSYEEAEGKSVVLNLDHDHNYPMVDDCKKIADWVHKTTEDIKQ